MRDFEKLGVFYLGKAVDGESGKAGEAPLLYESKDLLTHAVCVGMTGSGKTGLCIGLLEEAAIDGIPAIAIDPKGDIGNLLLAFPELRAQDFRPWINEDEARTKGVAPDEFAAGQAELWKKGLASFGQDGARIQRMRDAAEFAIYTPASEAGISISILKSFAPPDANVQSDGELFRDQISSTATSLLALAGIDAAAGQSREHVLVSNILEASWRSGASPDLPAIITQIQQPPFQRAGVMDLETFYPAKDRFQLAMLFNNLLASPGFANWLKGAPLDIGSLLYTASGKPRIAILSIAHLSEPERMFFVSLLLNQILSWVRTQGGTTSLRALLYMDEIFGYFPPVANPPSKKPLLTLLKQARAYGLGVVLATQNPVDLDYKGLSNTGTWFIGRLQTERDKQRVMEGLEGAAGDAGAVFNRQAMGALLAGLGKRVFLLNNVREDRPQLFETRWTLSYLRGPLTREQVKTLMNGRPEAVAYKEDGETPALQNTAAGTGALAPVLPPDIPCYFFPVAKAGSTVYRPVLAAAARLSFADDKLHVNESRDVLFEAPLRGGMTALDWAESRPAEVALDELEREPEPGILFGDLPAAAAIARNYAVWKRSFTNWLFQTQQITLLRSPTLGEVSAPNETERDFRIRLQQAAREQRDRVAEELKQKYAPKFAALAEKKRRAELALAQQKSEQNQAILQTALTVGTGLLSAFLGRKAVSVSNVSRAATAVRQAGRGWKEVQDVGQASETVEQITKQAEDLQRQFAADLEESQSKIDALGEQLEQVPVHVKKTNIEIRLAALAWKAE